MAGHVTELTQLLAKLVRIDSTNPDLVADGAGERDCPLHRCLGRRPRIGGPLRRASAGRPSVVVVARGTEAAVADAERTYRYCRRGWHGRPFSAHIENGHLFGRGAYDMKGASPPASGPRRRRKSVAYAGT